MSAFFNKLRSPPFATGFWLRHLVLPLLLAGGILFTLEHSTLDLWLADQWYAWEGGQWALRNHWFTYDVLHHHGKQFIILLGVGVLGALVAGLRWQRVRPVRRPLLYLFTCMAALPALIAFAKRFSPVPCPWHLSRYGGEVLYQHNFTYTFGATSGGHCFPAGHASAGFALLAVYFCALPYVQRPRFFLLPGLVVGSAFALGQQARGAHFLSHDLWTLTLCWFGALALFIAFRPAGWPHSRFALSAASKGAGRSDG